MSCLFLLPFLLDLSQFKVPLTKKLVHTSILIFQLLAKQQQTDGECLAAVYISGTNSVAPDQPTHMCSLHTYNILSESYTVR